jgi:hypothetical protein
MPLPELAVRDLDAIGRHFGFSLVCRLYLSFARLYYGGEKR